MTVKLGLSKYSHTSEALDEGHDSSEWRKFWAQGELLGRGALVGYRSIRR